MYVCIVSYRMLSEELLYVMPNIGVATDGGGAGGSRSASVGRCLSHIRLC